MGFFWLCTFREASWDFPRQDHDFKEFRGFLKPAKSSGEGRGGAAVFVCVRDGLKNIYHKGTHATRPACDEGRESHMHHTISISHDPSHVLEPRAVLLVPS